MCVCMCVCARINAVAGCVACLPSCLRSHIPLLVRATLLLHAPAAPARAGDVPQMKDLGALGIVGGMFMVVWTQYHERKGGAAAGAGGVGGSGRGGGGGGDDRRPLVGAVE